MSKINVTCPKCHLIPFVNIKESKVPELEIKCPCSYEESLPLKDYLNVTEKRNLRIFMPTEAEGQKKQMDSGCNVEMKSY